LARRIAIHTTEREAFEAVRFLDCCPEIPATPAVDLILSVEPFRGRYRLVEGSQEIGQFIDRRSLVDQLHARLFSYSLHDRPRSGIVHAALLRRAGRRILIAGSRGAGKTTLVLHLLRAGYHFEGDEHVFVDGDGVIARPRACRVKEASLPLLPELAAVIQSAPVYVDVAGPRIFNVDPRAIGGTWRIEKGSVDRIVVLQPNHGGYSSLRSMAPMAVAQALISELGMRGIDRGAPIAAIAQMVSRAKGFDLSLGDHDGAVRCVDRALDD
jgi:energy-coupling factor transporter ATP-binding protein EcfA2